LGVLSRNPALRRARIKTISGCVSRLRTRRMIADTCSAVLALLFLLRTIPGDAMDMRQKSQPNVVVNTIMYRPAAPVKAYEFHPTTTDLKAAHPQCVAITVNAVLTVVSSPDSEGRAGWNKTRHEGCAPYTWSWGALREAPLRKPWPLPAIA